MSFFQSVGQEIFACRITDWPTHSIYAHGELVQELGDVGAIESETLVRRVHDNSQVLTKLGWCDVGRRVSIVKYHGICLCTITTNELCVAFTIRVVSVRSSGVRAAGLGTNHEHVSDVCCSPEQQKLRFLCLQAILYVNQVDTSEFSPEVRSA